MRPITATYRLQLHAGFGFAAARGIVEYLDELGVSHAYASPYMKAEPGSTHGYDMVDPTMLNPEVGTEREYLDFTETLASKDMGHILDFVPNHMGATTNNAWWLDVLENGRASIYADYFDIEWKPHKEALHNKVLLAVLGAQYGEVLEKGELRLERKGGAFFVRYYERCLPANPRSMWPLLERATVRLGRVGAGPEDPRLQELESIVTGLRNLPARTETEVERQKERAREKEVLKRRLAALTEDESVGRCIDEELQLANGTAGDAKSFDELDRILMEQSYRLAYWRVATEEINYRRFFDVNDLAAIRMESDAVFVHAHQLLLRLVAEGRLQGVRLDHTDGLYDPAEYFVKLRRAIQNAADGPRREVYLVAEKILSHGEELPQRWAIEGTTGYDFLVQSSGVFVDRTAEKAFTRIYTELTGDTRSFSEHARESKRTIMRSSLSSEMHMLSQSLERIAMRDRRSRDFTLPMLHRAVCETIAAFAVYRSYIRPDGARDENDEQIVRRATRLAQRRNPEVSPSVFEFVREVLFLSREPQDEEDRVARAQFAMRFQQMTGPVMAKSVEDTTFYRYVRFVALNEVGGGPERFGTTIAELHAGNELRASRWPRTMTATATHDTKRGEDVRARLAVLSEIPETWEKWVRSWLAIGADHVTTIEDESAPTLIDQYLFFQTVLGAYPLEGGSDETFTARVVDYAIKAAREAKVSTSWLVPDEAYEAALRAFITNMLALDAFQTSLSSAVDAIASHGASNGLAQVVLKVASPGIPDTYQGSELWDLSLVDPDNRRPVDYEARKRALRSLEGAKPRDLLATFRDGRVKLHVLRAGLRLRREMPKTFIEGDYAPIDAGDDVIAFTRNHAEGSIACAVTRRPFHVTNGGAPFAIDDGWTDRTIAIPRGEWRDALTGAAHVVEGDGIAAATLFAELPVALLVKPRAQRD